MRAALYARVSTTDQTCENQLRELREYVANRHGDATEFVEHGVSGAKRSRPVLDDLMGQLRRRRFDMVVVWSIDRLSRSVAHAAAVIEELTELGVTLVALRQGIDTSTTTGRAFAQMSSIFAEIERENIRERVRAGLARVKAEGQRLGRPPVSIAPADLARTAHLSIRTAGQVLGVPRSVLQRARTVDGVSRKPVTRARHFRPDSPKSPRPTAATRKEMITGHIPNRER